MPLLNSYEQVAYNKLLEVSTRVGAHVFPKV
jgi:hypothetical protein